LHIIVCLKHVPDTTELRLDPETGRPLLEYAPPKISDYDRNALEEGVRLKEGSGATVTVLSVGPQAAGRTLKEAVAAGADRAILVLRPPSDSSTLDVDPTGTARRLAAAIRQVAPFDLVVCGDVSEDGYQGLVPGMLAAALAVPQVSAATRLEVSEGAVTVTRVADALVETYWLRLPAVVSVGRAINTPRMVTTLQVIRVPTSRITTMPATELGMDGAGPAPGGLATRVLATRPAATPRRNELLTGEPDAAIGRLVKALKETGALP
jgi:electron transfer flavoprotein beta subunit